MREKNDRLPRDFDFRRRAIAPTRERPLEAKAMRARIIEKFENLDFARAHSRRLRRIDENVIAPGDGRKTFLRARRAGNRGKPRQPRQRSGARQKDAGANDLSFASSVSFFDLRSFLILRAGF